MDVRNTERQSSNREMFWRLTLWHTASAAPPNSAPLPHLAFITTNVVGRRATVPEKLKQEGPITMVGKSLTK
jgi:hypothetical protein